MISRSVKDIPPIKSVMTPFPHWVDADDAVARAQAMMAEHGVHHLPVMEGGQPIGVLNDAAIDGGSGEQRAREACDRNVYIVDLFEPLDRVLIRMAERRHEATLVVKNGKLVGVFTLTDACLTFGKLLRTLFPRGDGDAA
jgi:CBS domain-containing protein